MAQADGNPALPTDGTMVEVAWGTDADHDMFAIAGTDGMSLEVVLAPAHGPRWIREIDTYMTLLSADSTQLTQNDDWDDWYELEFYKGDVSNTYSRVFVDSLPGNGTYYVDAIPYYGTYRDGTPSIGNNAVGTYHIWAKMSERGVDMQSMVNYLYPMNLPLIRIIRILLTRPPQLDIV